jgi:hypothetical protein
LLATSRRIFAPAALATLLVALLALAPAATGTTAPVAGGKTELRLNQRLYRLLKKNDVKVLQSPGAKVRGRVATLTAVGGALDPVTGIGTVSYEGGIRFRAGKRQVALRSFLFDRAKRSLSAKIGGRRIKIASAQGILSNRLGFGTDLIVKALRLTGSGAKILNEKLGLPDVFKVGRSLGASVGFADPETVELAGGATVLTGSEGFFSKLKSLDVEVAPFEAAFVLNSTPPTFSFPHLPGGSIDLEAPNGMRSETGLRLIQKGGTPEVPTMSPVMSLVGLSISLESRTVTAGVSVHFSSGNPSLYGYTPIANLGAAASPVLDPAARTITVANLDATINSFLAEKLNETFAQPNGKGQLFKAGEPLGAFTITAQAR